MLSLNLIYTYILQPIKSLDMPSEDELEIISVRSNKTIDEIRASKSIQIQQRKEEIAAHFHQFRDNPKFRVFLRIYEVNQLEDILFGEHDTFLADLLPIIQEEVILNTFSQLNQQYNYFSPKDYERFHLFFKVCQFIADVVESNNSDDNSVAFLHAYKLMVLFKGDNLNRPFDSIDSFQNLHKTTLSHYSRPIHDFLIHDIPGYEGVSPMLPKDFQQWRILIHSSGPKAIKLFQQAKAINHHLGRAPRSLDEAQSTASQLVYPRAGENLKLASLCLQYNLSEKHFNRCLDLEQKRKTHDNLPSCLLDGATIGHPGYFLVKLPIKDLRAYVLGHLTNCCQSIGGHSESCVIDGITRQNCGFYVLLKGSAERHPLTPEGEINDEVFRIVGQGYAWLSTNDVLVFDSWENLRPEDDLVISLMLRRFATQLTSCDGLTILAVSIGTGGKTPHALGRDSAVIHETMKEGKQYGDSTHQWALAFNRNLFEELRQRMVMTLQAAIAKGFTGLKSMMDCIAKNTQDRTKDTIYPSYLLIELISQLFLKDNSYVFWNKVLEGNYAKLSIFGKNIHHVAVLCQLLVLMKDIGLLSNCSANDNFELIISRQFKPRLLEILLLLQQQGLLIEKQAQANFDAIVMHQDLFSLADILPLAQQNQLLTGEGAQANFETMIKHQDLFSLGDVLLIAHENHLLTKEWAQTNFNAIVIHHHLWKLAGALSVAEQHHLFSDEQAQRNFEAIVIHQDPQAVANALYAAKEHHLLTGDNGSRRGAIVTHQKPWIVSRALAIAQKNHLLTGEYSQNNFEMIIGHQNLGALIRALNIAQKNHLLTEELAQSNFEAIMNHPNLETAEEVLSVAQQNDLLTQPKGQSNFSAIFRHKEVSSLLNNLLRAPNQSTLDQETWIGEQRFFKEQKMMEKEQILISPRANQVMF